VNASTAVRLVGVSVLLAASWAPPSGGRPLPLRPGRRLPARRQRRQPDPAPHAFVGIWVTANGHSRQELLAGGRYEEARGGREKACTGRCTVDGGRIVDVDDTGFTATGDVRDGVLYHEHLVLYRESDPRAGGRATASGDRADGSQ